MTALHIAVNNGNAYAVGALLGSDRVDPNVGDQVPPPPPSSNQCIFESVLLLKHLCRVAAQHFTMPVCAMITSLLGCFLKTIALLSMRATW